MRMNKLSQLAHILTHVGMLTHYFTKLELFDLQLQKIRWFV